MGIPLTMRQLAAEGLPSLVARLVGRRHYLLAMRICQALGLSTEEVGQGWGCWQLHRRRLCCGLFLS